MGHRWGIEAPLMPGDRTGAGTGAYFLLVQASSRPEKRKISRKQTMPVAMVSKNNEIRKSRL
jgi:hypothetical protein